MFWATRTLLQLVEQNTGSMLPVGRILDYPDYGVRGLVLDCARKFIPLPYLKDLVKIMAHYKASFPSRIS